MPHTRNPFAAPVKPHSRNPFASNGEPAKKGRSADEMAEARAAKARKKTEAERDHIRQLRESLPQLRKNLKETNKNYDQWRKKGLKAGTIIEINNAFDVSDRYMNECIGLIRKIRTIEKELQAA